MFLFFFWQHWTGRAVVHIFWMRTESAIWEAFDSRLRCSVYLRRKRLTEWHVPVNFLTGGFVSISDAKSDSRTSVTSGKLVFFFMGYFWQRFLKRKFDSGENETNFQRLCSFIILCFFSIVMFFKILEQQSWVSSEIRSVAKTPWALLVVFIFFTPYSCSD